MGVIYTDTDEKSDLQRRIQADLREKQAVKPLVDGHNVRDSDPELDQAAYRKDFATSKVPGWVYVIGVLLVLGVCGLVVINQ